jgi:PAS domain S-box-containing protein
MSPDRSFLDWLRDPSVAAYAAGPVPAWVWSADASRILWANPVGAAIFKAVSPAAISGHTIDPKGSAALQIARLAASLPQGAAPRLERLRGFGGPFGRAVMCSCTRVILGDGTPAILIVATEKVGPELAPTEQATRLLANAQGAAALFTPNGNLLHATSAAQSLIGSATMLGTIGAAMFAGQALASGHAKGDTPVGSMTFDRIGRDSSTMLLVEFNRSEEVPAVQKDDAPVRELDSRQGETVETAATGSSSSNGTGNADAVPDVPRSQETQAEEPTSPPVLDRRTPMRFVWQLDTDNRFTLGTPEFTSLLGPRTSSVFGRTWHDISMALGLDPENLVAHALASRDTWSGINVGFPVDDSNERLYAELSGLPVFDRDRMFKGYRGFGVCRDLARIAELQARRSKGPAVPPPPRVEPPVLREERPTLTLVPPSENVVPFRPSTPAEKPTLTPVERKAFRDLATRLTARLRGTEASDPGEGIEDIPEAIETAPPTVPQQTPQPVSHQVPEAPKSIETAVAQQDQRPILDRLPVGVLVYRLDRLIYANRAFLDWTGYADLHALADAGGLDALFVEPSQDTPRENNGAKALTIATNRGDQLPVEARLFTSPWEGESALVLMLASVNARPEWLPSAPAPASPETEELETVRAEAKELRSIVDAVAEGFVVLDRDHRVVSVNHRAENLLALPASEIVGVPFSTLFAPESQRDVQDRLNAALRGDHAADDDLGREVRGRVGGGGTVPLLLSISPISGAVDQLCAFFRDISPWKQSEDELRNAKRLAEQASSAKSEFLAKISHEIRTPLNAILGFSEVMIEERFGAVGNDRYKQYLKDIHTSGEHVVALLNDLLDLSKIESGKLELDIASIDLNSLTQQCVAMMQPQATRDRIIIRTSLAESLPAVLADERSVRQIVLNLLSNSIKFTGPGGQVIVSTAFNDDGSVALRVRDTGLGMSEKEIAIALEPFRQLATSVARGKEGTGLGLPLTKALAEANRARFSIKSGINEGTLVEVAFAGSRMAAE